MGPDFADGAFVGEHGSWNRKEPVGYKVVFVPFSNGRPAGDPIDFVYNFRGEDGKTRRRPVGVTVDPAGALIVADDLSNTIWRVTPDRWPAVGVTLSGGSLYAQAGFILALLSGAEGLQWMRTYLIGIALLLASTATLGSTIYKYTDANGVVTYTDQRVPGARVFVFNDNMVEDNDRQVYVTTRKHAGGDTLIVKNDLYAPVEIELEITRAEHVLGAPAKPIRWVLPPRQEIRLLTLAPDGTGTPRYEHRLRYALGDPRSRHLAERYPLPWRGGPFRMTQGPGGRYSHTGPKGRYAVDIAMPVGTPIVAARGGVVIRTENSQSGRGTNPAGNFVRIMHDDGTMGVYLH